ncbi:MAG: hypothetical protein J6J93_02130 [Muribaculaceae bacterium]|nr:hypothetical protein [Muribaculaceae bacterium]
MKKLLLSIILTSAVISPAREAVLPIAVAPLEGNLLGQSSWDFSNQWIVDDKARMSVCTYGDSLLTETFDGRRFWYEICNDSLLYSGEEDRLTSIFLDSPAFVTRLPLDAGKENVGTDFVASGSGGGRRFDVSERGILFFSKSPRTGIMIAAAGDTVGNVLLVRERRHVAASFPDDSVSYDSRLITETYRWYDSEGIATLVPLAIQRTVSAVSLSNDTSVVSSAAYLPERCGQRQKASTYKPTDAVDDKALESALNASTVSCDGTTVAIRTSIPYAGLTVTADIMDAAGRLYLHESMLSDGTGMTIDIDCSGLRSGQYIAAIGVENTSVAPKKEIIIIRQR